MAPAEFWDLTPRETFMAIAAAVWREKRAREMDVALAWYIASLSRAKRLPPLKQLLKAKPAKALAGPELEQRRQEFEQMSQAANKFLEKRYGERRTEN